MIASSTIRILPNGALDTSGNTLNVTGTYIEGAQVGYEADRQHVLAILNSNTGNFRLTPKWGCNLHLNILAPSMPHLALANHIRNSLRTTGYFDILPSDILISGGTITIKKAYRIR